MYRPVAASPLGRMVLVLTALILFGLVEQVHAQVSQISARVRTATGRVEILRRGQNQTQWAPATVGMRLSEGDEIRAMAGASAELVLPDTSTLLLSENTRLAVSKLVMNRQTQDRAAIFHLAVGKVRAVIAKPAIQLVQTRQSNFAISTPGGVAATRGTTLVTTYDPPTATTLVGVLDGQVVFADFITKTVVTIPLNMYIIQTGSQPPSGLVPITSLPAAVQAALTGTQNPGTLNSPALGAPSSQPLNAMVIALLVTALVKASPGEAVDFIYPLVVLAPEFEQVIKDAAIAADPSQAGIFAAAGLRPPPFLPEPPGPPGLGQGNPNYPFGFTPGRDQQVCSSQPCS